MIKLKKYLFIFLLFELMFSYAPAYAQNSKVLCNSDPANYACSGIETQIRKYLCAPNPPDASQTATFNGTGQGLTAFSNQAAFNNNNNGVLYKCINQMYKFAIIVASVVGVFFIVIAGYIYMSSDGDAEATTKAKSILTSSIASIVILLGGYVLLNALNPDLVEFHSIQPPSVVVNNPLGTDGNFNPAVCKAEQGACQSSVLAQCDSWASNPSFASAICGLESGGRGNPGIKSGVDHCTDDSSFSVGLFQMNIISNGGASYMPAECPAGIFASSDGQKVQSHIVDKDSKNANRWNCKIANQAQYDKCVTALSEPAKNITAACALFKIQNWGAWKTSYNKCTQGVSQTTTPGQNTSTVAASSCTPTAANQTSTGGMLLIGDSLMHGMNPTFSSKGKVNAGSSCTDGDSISAALNKISGKISSAAAPTVAYISLGTNNYIAKPADILADQAKLITAVKQSGATKIVWIGPPKFPQPNTYGITPDQNRILNETLKSGSSGISYFDTYNSGLSLYPAASGPIDIHPTNYPAWANAILTQYGN